MSDAQNEGAIEELTPAEEASAFQELVGRLEERKRDLDSTPDGPRPRSEEKYKRRKIFVDWHLQVNYIGVYLATVTLLVVGFIALNYVFTSFFQRALAIQSQRPFETQTDAVLLITLNMIFILLLVIGMAVYAIIQSHRVAGPVLRFRRAIHSMHRRDYDFFIQLRQRDYLKDVAEQLNSFNNALKHKDIVLADTALELATLAKDHPELQRKLEDMAANLGDVVSTMPIADEPETT
jgi:hypothetical protein